MPHSPSRRLLLAGSLGALAPIIFASTPKTITATTSDFSSTAHETQDNVPESLTFSPAAPPKPNEGFNVAAIAKQPWSAPMTRLPGEGHYIAWTVDDGVSPETIRAYAEFAARTGVRLTFFVNMTYVGFTQNVDVLKPLVQTGQLQIANHTFSHPDLKTLKDDQIKHELEKNEAEIQRVFGVSAKPYFRPPYGSYDARVLKVAASVGYTRPVLWEGTLGDEAKTSARVIYMRSLKYVLPQRILLGHLNFTTIIPLLDRLAGLVAERKLITVTLNDYFEGLTEEERKASEPKPEDKKDEKKEEPASPAPAAGSGLGTTGN
ncbi:polysaccharide deacetylase family protein [Rothia dentocariosa]|uniref:polysaccharide deacetylase family protein n=1 Tax=Rothia dentocariosa TaxID=2047 RepID=UPI002431417B|nr:polysaccharide deacetylase family protein [Rothia dentocariosa]